MAYETFYLCIGGDGSAPKDGTCAHAWAVADFNNSANWTSSDAQDDNKLGPGDTIILMHDGGKIVGAGTATLTIQRSGLSGKPITIQGDGLAVVSGEGGTPTVGERKAIYALSKDYITINDLEICYGFRHTMNAYACDYWNVKNCEVHHCTADGTTAMLLGATGHDWTIEYCNYHDVVEDHLIYFFEDGANPTTNVTVQYCAFSGATASGVKFNGTSVLFTGIVVRYNYFQDNGYDDLNLCTTNAAEVYGNIFVHTTTSMWEVMAIGDEGDGTARTIGTKIWNNVFYGKFEAAIMMELNHEPGVPCIAELYDNIFFSTGGASGGSGSHYIYYHGINTPALIAASDYNLFHCTGIVAEWHFEDDTEVTTLADWRIATGFDTHSLETDPLFTDASNQNFSLTAGSPARGSGSSGGPSQGLSSTVRKDNFGRDGNVTLGDFISNDIGAYVSSLNGRQMYLNAFKPGGVKWRSRV